LLTGALSLSNLRSADPSPEVLGPASVRSSPMHPQLSDKKIGPFELPFLSISIHYPPQYAETLLKPFKNVMPLVGIDLLEPVTGRRMS